MTLFRIESFFIMNTESKKEDLFMKTAFEWDRELYVNAVPKVVDEMCIRDR